jgi:hypothetical protein
VCCRRGRFGFAPKTRFCCFVFDEARIKDLYGHASIDEQMSGAIDCTHATNAEPRLQQILIVQSSTEQRINRGFGNAGGIGLQQGIVLRTGFQVCGKILAACGAMKHKRL